MHRDVLATAAGVDAVGVEAAGKGLTALGGSWLTPVAVRDTWLWAEAEHMAR